MSQLMLAVLTYRLKALPPNTQEGPSLGHTLYAHLQEPATAGKTSDSHLPHRSFSHINPTGVSGGLVRITLLDCVPLQLPHSFLGREGRSHPHILLMPLPPLEFCFP